ncbi:MAG: 30S ribosomal protein S12 methylthiotransferase RimO [Clostridia bacterium]|nr:30S ribosomal protein S12 methylthiotransferase RimO [Clostridia bacterium]MDE7328751.1 30S ribosomal protein S12 methylthiotransferase RimO [Clostridia bacterium]
MKIGVVSLGCDKNRIDSENMLAYLQDDGYELTADKSQADIIIVNTCGFIDSAKQESIDTILEMAELKKDKCKYLIVTGCLTQRYMLELEEGFPEVDMFLGTANYHRLPQLIKDLVAGRSERCYTNGKDLRHFSPRRVLTTPYHYAYIKIAEGCDNKCTYCAIPSIRGAYTSRRIEDIVDEAAALVRDYAIKELILVAQDVSLYGKDLYGEIKLIELLKELSKLDVSWIRLLYLYPENVTEELIDYVVANDKICNYLDIPCQHVSNKILKLMNRRITNEQILSLIDMVRSKGDFTIRSTFIVGFPQESEEDFKQLEEFIGKAKLDRCGFFTYSKEDGTAASRLGGQIDEDVKIARQDRLYELQEQAMLERMRGKLGNVVDVLYEGIDYDLQTFYGRSAYDAPEIDTKIYFVADKPLEIGTIYKVKLEELNGLDYVGRVVE